MVTINENDAFKFYRYLKKHPDSKILKQNGGLMEYLQRICNINIASYFSLFTTNKDQPECVDLKQPIEKLINLTQYNKDKKTIFQWSKMIKPEDLHSKLLLGHGQVSEVVKPFTVPPNTYIIFLTSLGKQGGVNKSEEELLRFLHEDYNIYKDLIYLITFDFNDIFLKDFQYLINRVIYTPYSYCLDHDISIPQYKNVDCFTYYNKIDPEGKIYDFKEKKYLNTKVYSYEGIFDLPIKKLPDTTIEKDDIFFVYTDKKNSKEFLQKDFKPNTDQYELNKIIDPERIIYRSKREGFVISTNHKGKQETLSKSKIYSVIDKGNIYHCATKIHKQDKNYKIINDYSETKQSSMLLSELVYKIRNEFDKDYGKDEQLVIISPICRNISHLQYDYKKITSCIRIENNMINLLRGIRKSKDEMKILKESYNKINQIFSELNIKNVLSTNSSFIDEELELNIDKEVELDMYKLKKRKFVSPQNNLKRTKRKTS